MTLHPLAARFGAVADAYERGRPDYTPAVVGAIAAELGLAPGARVLDLAAGTGKLTRALIAGGFDAVAVEPQAQLREHLAAAVGAERALDGVAEAIPLADGEVAAVTVADAFHWFDAPRALMEIERVLAPGGGLAVLVTLPDWRGASWGDALGRMIAEARPEHPQFDGTPWQESVRARSAWTEPREIGITIPQSASLQRTLDYLSSISWVAALDEGERAAMLSRAATLIEEGEMPLETRLHVNIGLSRLSQCHRRGDGDIASPGRGGDSPERG
ncbi:MAG TPA: methyltransferase domain-containing protein [Solirubrobacteraceae bacterium]|nr:methyltransferase domain-containing protein [Solirubrobacteraceae bacterium]